MSDYLWIALPLLIVLFFVIRHRFRMSKETRKKWKRLVRALEHLKHGHATEEDKAIIDEANRLGLLEEHLSLKDHVWHVYYSLRRVAHDLYRSGTFPSLTEVESELEEYEKR